MVSDKSSAARAAPMEMEDPVVAASSATKWPAWCEAAVVDNGDRAARGDVARGDGEAAAMQRSTRIEHVPLAKLTIVRGIDRDVGRRAGGRVPAISGCNKRSPTCDRGSQRAWDSAE